MALKSMRLNFLIGVFAALVTANSYAESAMRPKLKPIRDFCNKFTTVSVSNERCVDAVVHHSVPLDKLEACGENSHNEHSFFICLKAAKTPATSVEKISTCGATTSLTVSYWRCLEAAKMPTITAQELKECGEKNLLGASYLHCLKDLGAREPAPDSDNEDPGIPGKCESVSESTVTCNGKRYVRDWGSVLDRDNVVKKVLDRSGGDESQELEPKGKTVDLAK